MTTVWVSIIAATFGVRFRPWLARIIADIGRVGDAGDMAPDLLIGLSNRPLWDCRLAPSLAAGFKPAPDLPFGPRRQHLVVLGEEPNDRSRVALHMLARPPTTDP